jgi:hypothetical protein
LTHGELHAFGCLRDQELIGTLCVPTPDQSESHGRLAGSAQSAQQPQSRQRRAASASRVRCIRSSGTSRRTCRVRRHAIDAPNSIALGRLPSAKSEESVGMRQCQRAMCRKRPHPPSPCWRAPPAARRRLGPAARPAAVGVQGALRELQAIGNSLEHEQT